MADNDIYNNEKKYNDFKENLEHYLIKPTEQERRRKYWIKNKANLRHFKKLMQKFASRDTSFIRRLRLLRTFLIVNHVLSKDLAEIDRDDIDNVLSFAHGVNKSSKSKRDFPLDVKFIWRQLFPEKDEKDRIDETITPYAVRHLTGKVDKSKEKLRGDKFSYEEFEKLVKGFADDPRMQCLLTISLESLSRPQELLGRKLKDVEIEDNYAKIYISEHGKEGTGFLRIIDSYFYLNQWLNKHPYSIKNNPEKYLFINTGRVNQYKQLKPTAVNKLIRERCKKLGINKPITLYSLKRNGVTLMRLRGKSDLDIQHTARWTSTKQLRTYDLSNQEDSFRVELVKRGLIKAKGKFKEFEPTTKTCVFCGASNGIGETICDKCQRPLDREVIEKETVNKENEIGELKEQMEHINKVLEAIQEDKNREAR